MEKAFLDLLKLIMEASKALKNNPPCFITAIAYLKMAEDASFKLLEHAIDDTEYRRLQAICNYSKNFCLRQGTWSKVAHFVTRFWPGVYDGFFDNTLSRDGEYYRRGYQMIRSGRI